MDVIEDILSDWCQNVLPPPQKYEEWGRGGKCVEGEGDDVMVL